MAQFLESLNQAEHSPEGTAGDSQFVRRILHRYIASPGIIPTAVTLGLAGRVGRLSAGRLPLLDAVQRRWALAESYFAPGASTLPLARLPVSAGPRPLAARVSRAAPGISPLSARAAGAVSAANASVRLRRTTPALPAPPAPPLPSTARGGGLAHGVQAAPQAAMPAHAGDHAAADWPSRRYGTGVEPARVHGSVEAGTGQSPGPPTSSGRGKSQPAGGHRQSLAGVGGLGAAILQRHQIGPARRAIQRQVRSAEPGRSQGRTMALGAGVPLPLRGPILGSVQHTMPIAGLQPAAVNELGNGTPSAGQRGGAQELMLPERGPLDSLPAAVQPLMVQGSVDRVASPVSAGSGQVIAASAAHEGGTRSTASVVGWTPLLRAATGTGRTITMRQPTMPLSKTALSRAGWPLLSKVATDTGGMFIMRQPAMSLPRAALPRAGSPGSLDPLATLTTPGSEMPLPLIGISNRASGSRRNPDAVSAGMPVSRLSRQGTKAPGIENARSLYALPGISATPLDLPLQRALADSQVAAPAAEGMGTVPSSALEEPALPTPARPDREGPDLERLADEVMAIIERRLTIQRESMGL